MKSCFLNGKKINFPKVIIHKGKLHILPTDEILIEAGYEIKEVEPAPITNETIKKQRQHAYRMRADQYLIAYQAYTELGELDKANEMKELWIKEREGIVA